MTMQKANAAVTAVRGTAYATTRPSFVPSRESLPQRKSLTDDRADDLLDAMDIGVGLGLTLPDPAMLQFHAGKPWAVVSGKAGEPNPGGRYVHVPGYTTGGPVCATRGRKQQMNWAFLAEYCDQACAIIDAADSAKKSALNMEKLDAFLRASRKCKPSTARKAPARKRLEAKRP